MNHIYSRKTVLKAKTLLIFITLFSIQIYSQENNSLVCSDAIDNDGDGLIDCNDPDCQSLPNNGCSICKDGISFADIVIDYSSGCNSSDSSLEKALGVSDWENASDAVFLGEGGYIKLGFTNNLLSNSGNNENDLYIFEVGPAVEASNLAFRPANNYTENILIDASIPDSDSDGFYEFGSISGSTRGYDIDEILTGHESNTLKFDAIQITDIANLSCSRSGNWPGADIDAVCALSSITLSSSEIIKNKNFVKMYPNPFQDNISLELPNNVKIFNTNIYNNLGQTVYSSTENKTTLKVEHLKSGLYILNLKTDMGTASFKIVKK
ncbi:T9SS type A sorting domain-containing protein [Tamlana crocina]|uniref:T9SS type A sorting domain-containing protein n=1 Tax=Tamlana crocina TaxID=393006 RepID=A0ABX1DFP0_9FLAO|nr:T9SS type A sorting domain-containing protein [Tamlana crocina]NJX15813.1 T9SS type A sorting domain-containing protein [Tamlana crocina]